MRPVFFADATDASLRREEQAFLIGDDLLVQPAWAPDAARPKGLWHPLTLVAGDGADPHQAQLFIRGGAVLPVGRAVQHTGERSDDPLTLLVCFDKQGCAEGRLYEDAGDGFGYRAGDYRLAHYKATRRADGQVDVQVSATGHRPVPAERVVRVLVVEADGRQRAAGTPQGL
jgi:alpha-glucosidase